ncbi:type III pantothenate kinase [Deltaproteobacteria bacterium OttesenSCG-928-M10]|nr:type III pantothenate kinase [Deltaproteobacteria bacterium OttesenSCG-928-M10]
MLFTMDVGNTNINLGLWQGDDLKADWRLSTRRESTLDELGLSIGGLFQAGGFSFDDVTGFIISSVVPPMRPALDRFGVKYVKRRPVFLEAHRQTIMPILYNSPMEMGADRVAVSVAAYRRVGGRVIVVDMGTATTFDCVSEAGEHMGGAIAPGLRLSAEALFQKASRLPRLELFDLPPRAMARDTTSSINVGLIYGYIGLVDGLVARLKKELGPEARVLATGGLAAMIAAESSQIEEVLPDLTLEGLKIIYAEMAWK